MKRCKVGTTHGRWSVKEARVFFAAVTSSHLENVAEVNRYLLTTAPILAVENIRRAANAYCDAGGSLLIDSGVFGIAMQAAKARGVDHNEGLRTPLDQISGFDAFLKSWKDVSREFADKCFGYVEIDLGGTEQKRKTRAMLESEGFRPIPVVHPITDGWDYFDELADTYDRLCIGNLVKSNPRTRLDILRTVAERRRGKRVQWIHALGVTAGPVWLSAPSESCDSSAPAAPLMFGLPMIGTSAFMPDDVQCLPYPMGDRKRYTAFARALYRDADMLRITTHDIAK